MSSASLFENLLYVSLTS
jgi:hypothetical protein